MNSHDIYERMLPLCPPTDRNRHYLKKYANFITGCVEKNTSLPKETYTEKHHILPKANGFWPEYRLFSKNPWNRAKLTERQHLIAHIMLAKALGGRMWYSLWGMINGKGDFYRPTMKDYVNRRLYELGKENFNKQHSEYMKNEFWTEERRKEYSEKCSGPGGPFYGKHHSEETKQVLRELNSDKVLSDEMKEKISAGVIEFYKTYDFPEKRKEEIRERQTGDTNSFYGEKHTTETKKKIAEASTGRPNANKGKKLSAEICKKISDDQKGKTLSEEHKRKIGDKHKGKFVSEETRKRISEAKKGKPSQCKTVTCPHCGKVGKSSGMSTRHFNNCKFKK